VETRFMIDIPQILAPTIFNAEMLADYARKWKHYIPELPRENEKVQALLRSCPIFVIVSMGRVVASAMARIHSEKGALISGAYAEPEFFKREYRPACIEGLCVRLERKASPTIYALEDAKDYPALDDFRKAGFEKKGIMVLYKMR